MKCIKSLWQLWLLIGTLFARMISLKIYLLMAAHCRARKDPE
jgi:hypothetical protein